MSKKTLFNQVKSHLEKLELKYEFNEEQNTFNFAFEMENTEVDIKIVCDEDNNRLFLSGFSSIKVPKDKRPAILETINEIHWEDFWNAHLFINEEIQHALSNVSDLPKMDGEGLFNFILSDCNLLNR